MKVLVEEKKESAIKHERKGKGKQGSFIFKFVAYGGFIIVPILIVVVIIIIGLLNK